MVEEILHCMDWKKDGKWNKEEILLDYAILSTLTAVVTSGIMYVML